MAAYYSSGPSHLTISKAYLHHYSDNDRTIAYVEWSDGSITQGDAKRWSPIGVHMKALFRRAKGERIKITRQVW